MESRETEKAFWHSHYEAWQATKITQEDYCKDQNIRLQEFKKWRALLSKSGEITALNRSGNRSKSGINFAPVSITDPSTNHEKDTNSANKDKGASSFTEIELKLPNKITLTIRCE